MHLFAFKDLILLEERISKETGVAEIDLVRLQNINPLVWLAVKQNVFSV